LALLVWGSSSTGISNTEGLSGRWFRKLPGVRTPLLDAWETSLTGVRCDKEIEGRESRELGDDVCESALRPRDWSGDSWPVGDPKENPKLTSLTLRLLFTKQVSILDNWRRKCLDREDASKGPDIRGSPLAH
jgi:hypothetical protein